MAKNKNLKEAPAMTREQSNFVHSTVVTVEAFVAGGDSESAFVAIDQAIEGLAAKKLDGIAIMETLTALREGVKVRAEAAAEAKLEADARAGADEVDAEVRAKAIAKAPRLASPTHPWFAPKPSD